MTTSNAEAEVRARLESWLKAVNASDLPAIMANYASDVRAFDAIGPLQFVGAEAYGEHWGACLSHMPGPMTFAMHDLDIAVGGDIAFAHYLAHCEGTGPDEQACGGWTRASVGLRKAGGSWLIVHEHFSAPCDMETGKAVFDLTPESAVRANAA